jgi:hypothetical protein
MRGSTDSNKMDLLSSWCMNRFILSQNRVQSRTRNMKVTLTPRHCTPDGDGSLGFVKKIGMYIQDVPGGKVNNLGGYSSGHSKQKNFISTCVLFRTVSEIEPFESKPQNC